MKFKVKKKPAPAHQPKSGEVLDGLADQALQDRMEQIATARAARAQLANIIDEARRGLDGLTQQNERHRATVNSASGRTTALSAIFQQKSVEVDQFFKLIEALRDRRNQLQVDLNAAATAAIASAQVFDCTLPAAIGDVGERLAGLQEQLRKLDESIAHNTEAAAALPVGKERVN